jgi:hypothetical protein
VIPDPKDVNVPATVSITPIFPDTHVPQNITPPGTATAFEYFALPAMFPKAVIENGLILPPHLLPSNMLIVFNE